MDTEEVYRFIQNPNRKSFLDLLKDNQGEADNLDFKKEWIEFPKLAKIILGMANIGGGILIFGLDEKKDGSIESVGLKKFMDKADVENKIRGYIPEPLEYDVADFDFSDKNLYKEINGKYQIMTIKSNAQEIPYILSKQIEKDEQGIIYVRRGTKTVYANSTDVARMIDKRIKETVKASSLKLEDHLAQLRVLYRAIHYDVYSSKYVPSNAFMRSVFGLGVHEEPEESYNEFILNVISKKKMIIERYVDR